MIYALGDFLAFLVLLAFLVFLVWIMRKLSG